MNPIAFSTLACPNWPVKSIIAKAVEFGFEGIEWRGGSQGHVQPTMSASEKTYLREASKDAGLMVLAVTAYTSFVSSLAEERQSSVDELRRYTDLAAELGADYVRAFVGELPGDMRPDSSVYENISDCLNAASEHAVSMGVRIAVEPHDDFARSSAVVPILDQSRTDLRVIWDIGNAFAAGEDPNEGFARYKNRLAYVQVKDGLREGSRWQLCSLGEGYVPLKQAFELLLTSGYEGALSVEWEYAWHPELDPPDTALPAALQVVRDLLIEIRSSQVMN